MFVVPENMEDEIIRRANENGHFAADKTIRAIEEEYYIPEISKKVAKFIKNCVRCIIYNKKLGKKEGKLNIIDKGDVPLNTIHIDHIGPIEATTKQYKYILTMVDGFSKFVWLFPTKTTSTEETLKKLYLWSDVFGFPKRLITDKAPGFTSTSFEKFANDNSIEHLTITTGLPRGNGQIERVNRTVLSILAKISADDPKKWYKYVGNVQLAINGNYHSSTKKSPFEIMFGVKINKNFDLNIKEIIEEYLIQEFSEKRDTIEKRNNNMN